MCHDDWLFGGPYQIVDGAFSCWLLPWQCCSPVGRSANPEISAEVWRHPKLRSTPSLSLPDLLSTETLKPVEKISPWRSPGSSGQLDASVLQARQVKVINSRYIPIVRIITITHWSLFKDFRAFLGYETVLDASNICVLQPFHFYHQAWAVWNKPQRGPYSSPFEPLLSRSCLHQSEALLSGGLIKAEHWSLQDTVAMLKAALPLYLILLWSLI